MGQSLLNHYHEGRRGGQRSNLIKSMLYKQQINTAVRIRKRYHYQSCDCEGAETGLQFQDISTPLPYGHGSDLLQMQILNFSNVGARFILARSGRT
jgi:hypothetical protein